MLSSIPRFIPFCTNGELGHGCHSDGSSVLFLSQSPSSPLYRMKSGNRVATFMIYVSLALGGPGLLTQWTIKLFYCMAFHSDLIYWFYLVLNTKISRNSVNLKTHCWGEGGRWDVSQAQKKGTPDRRPSTENQQCEDLNNDVLGMEKARGSWDLNITGRGYGCHPKPGWYANPQTLREPMDLQEKGRERSSLDSERGEGQDVTSVPLMCSRVLTLKQ